jgi:hypothetical protein
MHEFMGQHGNRQNPIIKIACIYEPLEGCVYTENTVRHSQLLFKNMFILGNMFRSH